MNKLTQNKIKILFKKFYVYLIFIVCFASYLTNCRRSDNEREEIIKLNNDIDSDIDDEDDDEEDSKISTRKLIKIIKSICHSLTDDEKEKITQELIGKDNINKLKEIHAKVNQYSQDSFETTLEKNIKTISFNGRSIVARIEKLVKSKPKNQKNKRKLISDILDKCIESLDEN